jgi:hypothetical protein
MHRISDINSTRKKLQGVKFRETGSQVIGSGQQAARLSEIAKSKASHLPCGINGRSIVYTGQEAKSLHLLVTGTAETG